MCERRLSVFERQWHVLLKLLSGRKSRKELSVSFGVCGKTIKRDINVLTVMFPLCEEFDGLDVWYWVDGYQASGRPCLEVLRELSERKESIVAEFSPE